MNALTSFSLRPCIATTTPLPCNEFMSRLQQVVEESEEIEGKFRTGHAMISIIESRRHFWSPWMHLECRTVDSPLPYSDSEKPAESNATGSKVTENNVIARFSPHPSIWTGIMLAYLSLVVLTFFTLILGYSQQLAQQPSWGYYLVPVWAAVGIALWAMSQVGQRLATQEMEGLIKLVESCLEHSESGQNATVPTAPGS